MDANGNGTVDDTTTVGASMSDDIVHRLQDLTVSRSDASPVGAMSNKPTPPSLPPVPMPANNSVVDVTSVQTRAVTSSCSKGWDSSSSKTMAAKLDRLRRRRIFLARLPPPSVASITDELQNLMAGAAAFRPTALELVGGFLLHRIAGRPLPRAARFIHDADVYAAAPDHLAATHAPAPPGPAPAGTKLVWYFFSPLHYQTDRNRKSTPCRRVGGSGTWKAGAGSAKLAEEGEAANWYVLSLRYYDLRRGGSSESWRMREYGIAQQGGGRLQPLVLCEVSRSHSGM